MIGAGAEGVFPEGWEKKINHDVKVKQIKKTPTKKMGREDVSQSTKRSNEAERQRGHREECRKEDGTFVNQDGERSPFEPRVNDAMQ
ncbi:hypothetical protein TNCV_2489331 [Trichonephila clavipes]|nr:hypothetical protein TNCV_2489331 [Trichonephila clavipes]